MHAYSTYLCTFGRRLDLISNLTFSLTNRCNQSDGLTSYTNLGPFVTFLIGYFVEFPRFRRRFFLGSGPVGDDVLWYHHIGGFSLFFFWAAALVGDEVL